jgi:hypothetical protein
MNNRFKPDPLILTQSILILDDDIIMPCMDIGENEKQPGTLHGKKAGLAIDCRAGLCAVAAAPRAHHWLLRQAAGG